MSVTVHICNAFTDKISGGNPAGVVLAADDLTVQQMQQIAARVGLSETAFFMNSNSADFRLRFFTPVAEVDLCGHATIAAFSCLRQLNKIGSAVYKLETLAGLLDVVCHADGLIFLEQKRPHFGRIVSVEIIADALNIGISALNIELPVQVVSTGLPDLLIPMKNLQAITEIQPDLNKISAVCQNYEAVSFHLFSLETLLGNHAHCRDFAPLYGITEEAATGTASGALACYLHKYGLTGGANSLIFEQGYQMNRPSEIRVQLKTINGEVDTLFVGGKAVSTGSIII